MDNTSTGAAPITAPVTESAPVTAEATPGTEGQAQPTPDLTPKKLKALKIKVDNQEFEEALPFEVDEGNKEAVDYLRRNLQLSKAASKRMQEANLTKKQAENFVKALQENPLAVLQDPRIMGEEKFRAIAEQYLSKKLQEQMMTPEQIKQAQNEERLRHYEQQEKTQKEQAELAQQRQLEDHYAQEYTKTIITALQTSNLPKNPYTMKRMAELMQKNLQHGLDLEPQHLAQLVKEDYQRELVSLIGASDPDQIIAMFGDEMTNKIRKADLAKLKASQALPAKKTQAPAPAPSPDVKVRSTDWADYIKKKHGL